MNMSTTTNSLSTVATPIDYVNVVLTNIAKVVSIVCVLIHVTYYILVAVSPKLQKRTFLYLNHANAANIVYMILGTAYIFTKYPNFVDQNVDLFFCEVSEIFWIFSNYIRMYSLLLIAVYRYLAVFKINWYKKINESFVYLFAPIVFIWVFSFALPISAKYIFNTTYSTTMCLDGYTTVFGDILGYLFYNYTIFVFFPTVSIVTIYVLITRKLNAIGARLGLGKNATSFEMSMSVSTLTAINAKKTTLNDDDPAAGPITAASSKKERKFANQFLLMCTFLLFADAGLSIFQLRNIIPGFYTVWTNWRVVIKIWVICNITAGMPILSIYYHPDRHKFIRKLKAKIMPN